MKNQVGPGHAINVVAPGGGFVSGTPYQIGAGGLAGMLFGVAGASVAAGIVGVLWTYGEYSLPKVSAQAWTVGQAIYWDNAAKLCTTVVAVGQLIGVATATAANPSAVGQVRLNGTFVSGSVS